MDAVSLQAVADLLKPNKEEDDDDIDHDTSGTTLTPASIGKPTASTTVKTSAYAKTSANQSQDIWNSDEITTEISEIDDPRPAPKYDLIFKQAVKAEDVFLGMGNKNPSTACCEDLLVKIYLPQTPYKEIELDITDTFLDCRTKSNYLGLHLPHKVDSKNAKARWNGDEGLLEVSLPLNRQYNFLNQ